MVIARTWARLRLLSRLLSVSAISIVIALGIAASLTVALAVGEARKHLDDEMRENMTTLSRGAAVSLRAGQAGQLKELLGEFALLPDVKAIGFHAAGETLSFANPAPLARTAPEWFVSLCAISERREAWPLRQEGKELGQLSLTLNPLAAINEVWEWLAQQLLVLLVCAPIAFFCLLLAVRVNLKPFGRLVAASQALGGGDFSQRIPVAGSAELRTAAIAFNAMAGDLGRKDAALRESEQLYASLAREAPVGIFETDAQGRVFFANECLLQMAGVSAGDLSAERWAAAYHPDDRDRVGNAWSEAMRRHIPAEAMTFRYVRPDGTITWAHARAVPLFEADGNFKGYVGVVTDITAERLYLHTIQRLSRLYATLSRVNSIIVQTQEEDALFEAVCHAVVDTGQFEQASISLVDWERRKIRQRYSFGKLQTPEQFHERDLDDPATRLASNMAALDGVSITVNDFANDERISPDFRQAGLLIGLRATTAIPLWRCGRVVGTLSFVSGEKDFFTAELLELIDEIGRDVSFALDNLERMEQRREAEAALVKSERNLNVTLRSIGDAVLVTDTAGRVTLMNPIAEALTGWGEAEARGRLASEVFHIVNQETRAPAESPVEQVLRDGAIVGLANHTVLIAKDGSERPIADSGAPIRYAEDGAVNGVVLVFRDQSEEYRMQKALKDSEQRYSSLVTVAPVGIMQSDRNGQPTYVNAAMRQLAGIESEDLSVETWAARVFPEDREKVVECWRQLMSGSDTGHINYRCQRPDGTLVWVQLQASPLLDSAGEISGYVTIVTDVTKETELRTRTERLSRLYATLSRVNSIIVQVQEEEALFDKVCRAVVDAGQFEQAAISRVDWERRKLQQILSFGTHATPAPYRERELDDPEAQSISNLALLGGIRITANDYIHDERISPRYREAGRAVGMHAAAAVPLWRGGKIFGTLSFVAGETNFFSDEILELIDEIGRDVSFALDNLDRMEQRRLAEAALVKSERNLNVTLHSIGDAVLVTDTAGRVTLMNPVAEALTGWSEAEARGRAADEVFVIVNQETRAPVESPVRHVLRDGAIVGLANHTVLIAKDGSERPIADSGAPIRYAAAGEVDGVVLVFRDQSEEYRMQKALRDSEQLYSSLAQHVPLGICLLEVNGGLSYANEQFLKITGLEAGGIRSATPATVIHPDDLEQVSRSWGEAISGLTNVDFGAYRYLHRDGKVVWVHGRMTPLPDEHGRPWRMIGVIIDITAEQEHLLRIERLSRFNATLSQMNAAIAQSGSEQELYERICRVAVGSGGFDAASIYLVDSEDGNLARRVAYANSGNKKDSVDALDIGADAPWTLLREAVRGGATMLSLDLTDDARLDPFWREAARANDLCAGAFLPLKPFGAAIGSLGLYTKSEDLRDTEVLALIEEMGRDISHALENLAHERERARAEAELARNEERLRLGLSVTRIGMYETNYALQRISLDAVCVQLMGLGEAAIDVELDTFSDMLAMDPHYKIEARQVTAELMTGKRDTFFAETALPLPDGGVRWLRNYGALTAERTAQGLPVRLLGVISDITAAKQTEARDRMAATVFDNSGETVLIVGIDYRIMMVNPTFTRIYGHEARDVLGTHINILWSSRHDPAFYESIAEVVNTDGIWQGEIWRVRKNGEEFPALVSISTVKDAYGNNTHYVLQETDISKQKEFEARISHLAYRDALTDLPNRALLRDRVEQSIASAHRDNGTLALLFLDLDHFKNINDSLGHAAGDHLLMVIAERLGGAIREKDTVGRLGGDEFLILLPDADADAAAHVAHKMLEESTRPCAFGPHTLTVTPSIGIALYPKDGRDYDELLKTADTAMYRAKEEGRNTYRFFTPEMNQAVFQRMVLESSLHRAVLNNEFVLHYQPKFDLHSRALVGAEALIRWNQPEMGMISPAQFIPVAEESGLIEAIGQWALEETCRQVNAWQQQGLPPLRVAVNFSARQFAARNITALVGDTLEKFGVPGTGLEMEITESLLAQDLDYTLEVLRSLKKLGIQVAIDDFGTGYSSLSYLKRFPIDRLKIDQSFVRDLVADADDRAIAAAIVTMGHSLGMRVIAEGVETAEQMEVLREMGCDEAQGYYLSRPIAADKMTELLRAAAIKPSRGS